MKYLNYVLILVGAIVAMYAKVGAKQNQYLLIVGIVFLMMGVYRISRLVPSRKDEDLDNNDSIEDQ
ncbi:MULTISPECIES: hypothetical protein [unclassified Algibacter]|uniref:hypothetical protein n=1 Tax=unclassified Algibacter TaxID=2615009 RepID=UPI00131B28D2|nr:MULTISPECIES: hypothetical protein [unclassified Algibacter]MCL5129110.1 hypothetical protein [Algibacter sp. L4_22]